MPLRGAREPSLQRFHVGEEIADLFGCHGGQEAFGHEGAAQELRRSDVCLWNALVGGAGEADHDGILVFADEEGVQNDAVL